MSQRNSGYDRKPNDAYNTPSWVTGALVDKLGDDRRLDHIWEPAAGAGFMVASLLGSGCNVIAATDVLPRHPRVRQGDFLETKEAPDGCRAIITNPPFAEAGEKFVEHALKLMQSRDGLVAMLFRSDYDHAASRKHLFADHPAFARRVVLTRRIVWFVEGNGKPKASPSVNHSWFLWDWKHRGPPIVEYAP